MASLRFHKVSSLPTSGYTVGDVYYVVGQGIYVATSTTSCTKFAYANAASTTVAGVTQLSNSTSSDSSSVAATSKAVKDAYDRGSQGISDAADAKSAANSAKDIANGKWTAKDASTSEKGIMKVGTGLEASSGTVSVKYGSDTGTACAGNDSRLSDARTPLAHNQASDTINKMTGYSKPTSASAIVVGDTLNAAIGKLEKGVEDAKSLADGKWAQKTATQANGGNAVEGTVKGYFASTSGFSRSPIINGEVWYKDTNTHNSHKVSFTNNAASDSTGDSVAVVTTVNDSNESYTSMSASTTRVNVPTLAVTNSLASRINSLEGTATTGMQYMGTTTAVPAKGKVGDVYKVTQAITGIGAEVGDFIVCNTTTSTATNSAWDVWQANIENNAYWDINNHASGQIVVADGTTGKIKTTGFTTGSFDTKGAAAGVLGKSGDSAGTATVYGAIAKATAVQSNLDNHTGNTDNPHKVTKAQVGLSNVTNNRQVVGLSTGTTAGHFVTWGANGYTVADSGLNSDSFAPKTHTHKSSDVTAMTGYTKASSATAIATSDSLNVAIGKLEKGVEVAQSTAEGKWTKVVATTSTQGIASFNSSNFAVSSGAVSLVWATWPE